ncbi:hypothetical protein SDC9_200353 [bioreactor metagenome]|uniref:DUF3017 domain-containing protein n=1 Tax=bioreactor metagenome TaxID=1076179 RepID=A0A645IN15_9ZZZZ
MSKLIASLYKTPTKREMSKTARIAYILCGITAVAMLVSAYYSSHQLFHQVGTTGAIFGMLLIRGGSEVRKKGFKPYMQNGFSFDFAMLMIWLILLVIWIVDPQI